MTGYRTHPLNKRVRPNLTDVFDNGHFGEYVEDGQVDPIFHKGRAYLTDQAFRHIINKASSGRKSA